MGIRYADSSQIRLISPAQLKFINAEKMLLSSIPCNGIKRKHIVGTQYHDGSEAFSRYIKIAVEPLFSRLNLSDINYTIEINGEVKETGDITDLKYSDTYREDIARSLILKLKNLPVLIPATADGVPIKQKFSISFKMYGGLYSFTYRFLPISFN